MYLGISMFFYYQTEIKGFFLKLFFFPEVLSVFSGCKVETIKLNVEAVNTHRDKPTVSIFPWMTRRFPATLSLEPLTSRDWGFFYVQKEKLIQNSCPT